MRYILALDPAIVTGWAAGLPGKPPASGVVRLKAPDDPPRVAFANVMEYLRDLWTGGELPSLLVKEAPLPLQAFRDLGNAEGTVRMTFGLHAAIEGMCHRFGIPHRDVAAQTVRKHFIGRSSMGARAETKAAVVRRCHLLGYMPPDHHDDNRADALATWDWAAHTLAGRTPDVLHLFGEVAA